jgi:hypothetical protein
MAISSPRTLLQRESGRDALPVVTGYGTLIGAWGLLGAHVAGPVGAGVGVCAALVAAFLVRKLINL